MKRLFRIALFALLTTIPAAVTFAQQAVIVAQSSPEAAAFYIKQAAQAVQTVTNTAQEAKYALQSYQATLQSLKQLGQGNWSSLVSAFDYETEAMNNYNNAVQQLPTLDQINAIRQLTQTQGYQVAAAQAGELARSFNAADETLHSANSLIQDTKYRNQAENSIMNNAMSAATTPVQLAQDDIQSLNLLQGEMTDTNMLLASMQHDVTVQQENQQMQQSLFNSWANRYNNTNTTYVNQAPDWTSYDTALMKKH